MLRRFALYGAALCSLLASFPTRAEPIETSPDGFHLSLTRTSTLSEADVLAKLSNLPAWWSSDHTYSGNADNLSLSSLDPGGVWLEQSDTIAVQHGRVISNIERGSDRVIRFDAAFGPLQEIGAKGILSVTISPETDSSTPDLSQISFSYYVTGASFLGLDQWAGPVDRVLSEQIDRLAQN